MQCARWPIEVQVVVQAVGKPSRRALLEPTPARSAPNFAEFGNPWCEFALRRSAELSWRHGDARRGQVQVASVRRRT